MTISRNPSYPPGGPPSYTPDTIPVYRGGASGGGSTPAYDPDSLFTASRIGDYWEPSGFYQDNAGAVPADTAGDVIQESRGSRTVQGPTTPAVNILKNATVAQRPSVAEDATYGPVMRFIASSGKYLLGLNTAILSTALVNNGGSFVVRLYVNADSTGTGNGHALVSNDRTDKGLFIYDNTGATADDFVFGANNSSTAQVDNTGYTGKWITVVGIYSGGTGTCDLYIDDPDTPVGTDASETLTGLTRIIVGPVAAGFTAEVLHYKRLIIDDPSSATVAQLMSWAEA